MPAQWLEAVVLLAEEAGRKIMEVYTAGAAAARVREKEDRSPLTLADQCSHNLIVGGLAALTPSIPIISEESDSSEQRALNAALRWVVDPLDGTKEFIKRTNEFTVNIALVDGTGPVLGVVHAPALGVTWLGTDDRAERREGAERKPIHVTSPADVHSLRVVASRDHAGPTVLALLARLPNAATLSMGSSLKFCLIAEGSADFYFRDGPTMEWDTAAAHAVLRAAGGDVFTLDGQPLSYGKPGLRNPHFAAVGSSALNWQDLIGG